MGKIALYGCSSVQDTLMHNVEKILTDYYFSGDLGNHVSPQEARSGVGYTVGDPINSYVAEGAFPFFTLTAASPRLGFEELWWMLRGGSNSLELESKGVNFWKGNTSREFLDSRGLDFLDEGSMGASYGFQWRKFGKYGDWSLDGEMVEGVDQLHKLIKGLVEDPFSRRHLVSLWNPLQEDMMPLTPCWYSCQFSVRNWLGEKRLDLHLNNRSLDIMFGAYFAISQYRLLQAALCSILGFSVGKLYYNSTIPHIYDNQELYAKEMCTRKPLDQGGMEIVIETEATPCPNKAIDILLNMEWGKEVIMEGYEFNAAPFKNNRPEMVA